MTEFKINEYLKVKLEDNKTGVYLNDELFTLCKNLKLKGSENKGTFIISSETEFWGHCSALQAWVENDYSLNIIGKHYALSLLKKLRSVGDLKAKKALSLLTNCIYCSQVLSRDDVYCPNCRKLISNPDNPRHVGTLNFSIERAKNLNEAEHLKAIESYKLILKEDPQNVRAQYFQGGSYYHLKKYRKAICRFKKAIKIDPANESRYYHSVIASFVHIKRFHKALLLCESLIKRNPKNNEYLLLRARVLGEMGEYDKAMAIYNKYLESAPEPEPNVYAWLGSIYNSKYEYSNALRIIRRGLQIWESDSLSLLKWRIKLNMGEYDRLVPLLRKALRKSSNNDYFRKAINYFLGEIYLRKGKYYKANKFFKLGINPYFNLSLISNARRKYKKAIQICEKAVKTDRWNEDIWTFLGINYSKIRKFEKAEKAIKMASALNPYSIDVKLNLAYINNKRGLPEEAIIICKKVLEKIPNHLVGHLYEGYAYFDKGNFENALDAFKKVLEINPNSDSAKLYLAKICFQQKMYNEALEVIKGRFNPYSRDFFELVVEILNEAYL